MLTKLCIPSIVEAHIGELFACGCRKAAVRFWLGAYTVRSHFLANILTKAIACAFGNAGEVDKWLSRTLCIIPVFRTVSTILIHAIMHK